MAEELLHWIAWIGVQRDRRRTRATLMALSDHHLAAIGIERGGIDDYASRVSPPPVRAVLMHPGYAMSLQDCG